jgi:hypothetical protein
MAQSWNPGNAERANIAGRNSRMTHAYYQALNNNPDELPQVFRDNKDDLKYVLKALNFHLQNPPYVRLDNLVNYDGESNRENHYYLDRGDSAQSQKRQKRYLARLKADKQNYPNIPWNTSKEAMEYFVRGLAQRAQTFREKRNRSETPTEIEVLTALRDLNVIENLRKHSDTPLFDQPGATTGNSY